MRGDADKDDEKSRGILQFLAAETDPQPWKLQINENDYPLVLVDKRIPNAGLWARNDPVFVGTALPIIVRQIFEEIIRGEYSDDLPWVVSWLQWADTILPGAMPSIPENDRAVRQDYLDRLVDTFCSKHDLAGKLLAAADREEA